MNIFHLDNDLRVSAEYQMDRHSVKMILESAQILSTVCRLQGYDCGYKMTHRNHPCTKWCAESLDNWIFLREYAGYMNEEWKYRFNHTQDHKSWTMIQSLKIPDLPKLGLTKLAQAMPDEYKNSDSVIAYRNYYIGEKQHLAQWTKRNKPEWWKGENK